MALREHEQPSGADPAKTSRLRIATLSFVVFAAVTISCGLAAALALSHSVRVDMTAARSFALAERTKRIVASLDSPYEIVVVADSTRISSQSLQRVSDLLAEMAHASANLKWTRIDEADPADAGALRDLLDRVATRDAAKIASEQTLAMVAIDGASALSDDLASVAASIGHVHTALAPGDANAAPLRNQENVLGLVARRVKQAAVDAKDALKTGIAGSNLPALDLVRGSLLGPLTGLADQLESLSSVLEAIVPQNNSDLPSALKDAVQGASAQARSAAERARAVEDSARQLGDLDGLRVARLLERESAVVVMGPDRSTGVSFSALFPTAATIESIGATKAEVRFTGEELVASALASLSMQVQPTVVFVHAAPEKQFDEQGRPVSASAQQALGALVDRLHLRDIHVREWAAAIEPQRPALAPTPESSAERRAVWVVIPTSVDSAQSAENMGKLADAVSSLVDAGKPVLVSVNLSRLPGAGQPDPMVAFLAPLGVRVDSGLAILSRDRTAAGVEVHPEHIFRQANTAHPIGAAINGLAVLLAWMAPITFDPSQITVDDKDVQFTPLLTLPDDQDRWAESQWETFRALGGQRRSASVLPEPNPSVDQLQGPWIVAAAIERRVAERAAPQRLVVVGAHGWWFDPFTQLSREVNGARVTLYPGATELFEAAVYWLAGLDDMIAPASLSRDVPRISPMSRNSLLALRWGLIAGLPIAILALGLALRFFRP